MAEARRRGRWHGEARWRCEWGSEEGAGVRGVPSAVSVSVMVPSPRKHRACWLPDPSFHGQMKCSGWCCLMSDRRNQESSSGPGVSSALVLFEGTRGLQAEPRSVGTVARPQSSPDSSWSAAWPQCCVCPPDTGCRPFRRAQGPDKSQNELCLGSRSCRGVAGGPLRCEGWSLVPRRREGAVCSLSESGLGTEYRLGRAQGDPARTACSLLKRHLLQALLRAPGQGKPRSQVCSSLFHTQGQ